MASAASLEKRYKRNVAELDFYGAEQACRMLHHRLTSKATATDADKSKALEALFSGTEWLLSNSQAQAGCALGLLALKHCVTHTVKVDSTVIGKMISLAAAFKLPEDKKKEEEAAMEIERERLRFLRAAVAWSAREDCDGTVYGAPSLNAAAAKSAASLGDNRAAQTFFVRSDDPVGFAQFLHNWANTSALPSEKGLLFARGVLLYLNSDNLADANALKAEFFRLQDWPTNPALAKPGPNAPIPLANFTEILCKICEVEERAAPLFEKISATYMPHLKKDPALEVLLGAVGLKYFKIRQPQMGGIGGMMSSMIRGLMTGSGS